MARPGAIAEIHATGIDRAGSADNPARNHAGSAGSRWPAPRGLDLVAGSATLAAEAVRAVDGLSAGRAEGDLGLTAAGRACCSEHLTGTAIAAVTAAAATAAVATRAAAGTVA